MHEGCTVTASQIEAGDITWRRWMSQQQKDELIAWLGEQGVPDPGRTVSAEYVVVDAPLVHVERHARDEDDRIVVEGDTIVRIRRDYLVRTPLPDWWRPVAAAGSETPDQPRNGGAK